MSREVRGEIAHVSEGYPKFPDFHRRLVFEYVGRDENVRRKIEYDMRNEEIPVTCSVCNGKYHGMRTLISMWPMQFDELKGKYRYLYEATLNMHLDGRQYNETPMESKTSLQVLDYMREGSKHYTLEEISKHCPLSFIFLGNERNFAWMYASIVRSSEGEVFFNLKHVDDLDIVVSSTIQGWLRFLSDQRSLIRAAGRKNELYEYIDMVVHRFYRNSNQSISIPEGFEPEQQWR